LIELLGIHKFRTLAAGANDTRPRSGIVIGIVCSDHGRTHCITTHTKNGLENVNQGIVAIGKVGKDLMTTKAAVDMTVS